MGMTEQEAIKVMKWYSEEEYGKGLVSESHRMSIKALEKQIAKKIIYREQAYGTPWLCPECEADQIKVEFFCEDGSEPKEKHTYCWKCGQKLDWGNEDAE